MESSQPVANGKKVSGSGETQCQGTRQGGSQIGRTMSAPLGNQVPEESSKPGVVVRYYRLFGFWLEI